MCSTKTVERLTLPAALEKFPNQIMVVHVETTANANRSVCLGARIKTMQTQCVERS